VTPCGASWSKVVAGHQQGTRYNIHVDTDSLLYAGQHGVQLTWMDAKVGDWVVTPRIGKPVEINALWHNALKTMAHFARLLDKPQEVKRYKRPGADGRGDLCGPFPAPGRAWALRCAGRTQRAADISVRPTRSLRSACRLRRWNRAPRSRNPFCKWSMMSLYTEVGCASLSPHDPAFRPRL